MFAQELIWIIDALINKNTFKIDFDHGVFGFNVTRLGTSSVRHTNINTVDASIFD
ncbi:MAG: hypothetical protein QM734_15125 [Cyclobacteriaceae bacterium]